MRYESLQKAGLFEFSFLRFDAGAPLPGSLFIGGAVI